MASRPRRLGSKELHRGGPLRLRVDRVEMAGSTRPVERMVVEYQPASVLVPLDSNLENVLLTRQHRYPVGRDLWEIPGGMINPGESAEKAAVREFEEETGHRVEGSFRALLTFFPEPAFADHRIDVFSAVVSDQPLDDTVLDADVDRTEWVSIKDALRWIADGEVASSWSVIGLLSVAYCAPEPV